MNDKEKIFSKIVLNNIYRERKSLSRFACRNDRGVRKYPEREKILDRINIRPIFFHDTDRIMHSLAYSRYIDKTQVFYLFENDHVTHRTLHVQLVSKIARVIGRSLRLNEDLIEAISLGHDLGHAPYGHDGEKILNQLCEEYNTGYFSHNVQSVKILMEIEEKGNGLNLSLQVFDGILSHNGENLERSYVPDRTKTWIKFEEEYKKCFKERDYNKKINPMTLEGCVVKIADIISYVGRDIEDAIAVKLIKRKDIPEKIKKIIGNSNKKIINNLVLNLIINSFDKDYLTFSHEIYDAINNLLKFNFDRIYNNPRIKTEKDKIESIYRRLFENYLKDLKENRLSSPIFHFFLKDMNSYYIENTNNERKVVDFISGMTDDFFNNQFNELCVPRSYGYELKPTNGY